MSEAALGIGASESKLSENIDGAAVFTSDQPSSPRPRRTQKVYPVLQTHRYDRGTKLEETPFKYTVHPQQTNYQLEGVPDGWEAITHPEGSLYFYDRARRIYTEAWLCDPEIRNEIEDFAALLDEVARAANAVMPSGSELVLELEVNPTEATKHYWTYYYVDHTERVLFWLHDYTVSDDLERLKGFHSPSHIKHGIERYYCQTTRGSTDEPSRLHWEFFPIGQAVTDELRNEVLCILVHASVDQMTSASSTVQMSPDVMDKLMTMVKTSRDLGSNQYTACALGRLMGLFANDRYYHHFGQKAARLDRQQRLFDDGSDRRTPWILALSTLLFNAPAVHLRALQSVWLDGIVQEAPWTRFVADLHKEWLEAVIAAAVLLNVNVSFLPITDTIYVQASGHRTSAQIMSLVSTIACIFSALLGMLLIRQYRVNPKETASDAVSYLTNHKFPVLGLENLAIAYSLPYALFLWGTLTFIAALALECFDVQDKLTMIVTATAWGLSAFLVVLFAYTLWGSVHETTGSTEDGPQQEKESSKISSPEIETESGTTAV